MKLDQIPENDSAQVVRSKKAERHEISSFIDNNATILEMLNPLKSINLTSNLHSFYNFKELKKQVEVLMRTQSNIIFYILHQNFMVDNAHKDFFKNMVGRFYDLPEWAWDYYQGLDYRSSNDYTTMLGLVLMENKHYYKKYRKPNLALTEFTFARKKNSEKKVDLTCFNKLALEEYWGGKYDKIHCAYYVPYNKIEITDRDISNERSWEAISFDKNFEFGRFNPNSYKTKRKEEELEENFWFIASDNWIKEIDNEAVDFCEAMKAYSVYASLGLDNFEKITVIFKELAKELGIADWDDSWIPNFEEDETKLIRSLSQTFSWSKEYIYENEDILDLDVLGLNMTVPWDMELVKFFIERGYGGRMSENKAVFYKVFEPILTDEIIRKLFNCEYERYE
ncbi:MAG: hypothetical protein JZU47_05705 [Prolixibacteraceae bacterium]|nr:hypothetical protein [Prolixibacteraceae bacterium]